MDEHNAEEKTFDVVMEATGRAVGKARNEITVHSGVSGKTFEIATDEGPIHGGDSSAPPPLAYFAAATVACMMTQIRAFSKRLDIVIDDVTIGGRFRWRGRVVGRAPYETEPVGFDLDIDIASDATPEELKKLIAAAKKGCFIEQTLSRANTIGHRLRAGEDWIDV